MRTTQALADRLAGEGMEITRVMPPSRRAPIIEFGDYNGEGTAHPAVFRPSSSLWAIRDISRLYFGSSSDQPVPADYDGDGSDGIGILRDSVGLWAVMGITRVYFGSTGDIPVTK